MKMVQPNWKLAIESVPVQMVWNLVIGAVEAEWVESDNVLPLLGIILVLVLSHRRNLLRWLCTRLVRLGKFVGAKLRLFRLRLGLGFSLGFGLCALGLARAALLTKLALLTRAVGLANLAGGRRIGLNALHFE